MFNSASLSSRLTASQFGLGFWQTWWTCALCTNAVLPKGQHLVGPFDPSTFLLLAAAVGYVVATLATRKVPSFLHMRGSLVAASTLCAGGTIGMGVSCLGTWNSGGIAIFGVAAVGFSLGNALLLLMWGERWSTLASGQVGRCLYTSYAFALAAFFCISALPWLAQLACMTAAPCISVVLLRLSLREASREPGPGARPSERAPFVRPLVAVFVLNIVWGAALPAALRIGGPANIAHTGLLLALVGTIVLMAYMMVAQPATEAFALNKPVGAALAGGLILLLALPSRYAFVGYGVATLGGACLDMLVMLVATDMAFKTRRPAALVLGCAMIASRMGSLGGRALYSVVIEGAPDAAPNIVLWSILAVVLCVLLVFSQSDLHALYRTQPVAPHGQTLEDRCQALASAAGLTPREREILALLAQGRSAPYISQELSITTGTVKNHVSNIYRKVDVGDRQGLLNLLEQRP